MASHPVSMQHLFDSDGKANIWGWIIFFGTVLVLAITIYQAIKKINTTDADQQKKLKELELNLKAIRGDQYLTI